MLKPGSWTRPQIKRWPMDPIWISCQRLISYCCLISFLWLPHWTSFPHLKSMRFLAPKKESKKSKIWISCFSWNMGSCRAQTDQKLGSHRVTFWQFMDSLSWQHSPPWPHSTQFCDWKSLWKEPMHLSERPFRTSASWSVLNESHNFSHDGFHTRVRDKRGTDAKLLFYARIFFFF